MDADQRTALAAIAMRLERADVPFLLGGSGLLHALGLPVSVRDLDLMARPQDHDALREAAGDWWQGSAHDLDERHRSDWLATLRVAGVAVEVMAGLAVVIGGEVVALPFRQGGMWSAEDVEVPLAAPEVWWLVYRGTKPGKAALLESVIPVETRQALLEELGVRTLD